MREIGRRKRRNVVPDRVGSKVQLCYLWQHVMQRLHRGPCLDAAQVQSHELHVVEMTLVGVNSIHINVSYSVAMQH
jgi:hypothetical protein